MFFVRDTDPSGEEEGGENGDEVEVTVTATDVNEVPAVSGWGRAELEANEADSSRGNRYVGLGDTGDADGVIILNATTINLCRGPADAAFDIKTRPDIRTRRASLRVQDSGQLTICSRAGFTPCRPLQTDGSAG